MDFSNLPHKPPDASPDDNGDANRLGWDAGELARALVAQLPGGATFVVTQDGSDLRYLLAEGEALAAAGFTPDDFVGKTVAEAVGPELAAHYEPLYRGALERGEPFSVEHDSHGRYYSTRGTPLCDATGRVYAVLAVSYDMTERKRAEEQQAFLLRLSDTLRPLAGPAAVMAAASRILGEQLGANRAFYAEVEGDDWLVRDAYERGVTLLAEGRHPIAPFGPWIENLLRTGQRLVLRNLHADARFDPAQRAIHEAYGIRGAVAVPLVKEERLVAILVVHSAVPRDWSELEIALVEETAERTWDAVEQARAEAALKESEEKYRALFSEMDEAYAVVEVQADAATGRWADFVFLEVNAAFMRHTGMPYPVGRTASDLLGTPNPRWAELYGHVAETGESIRVEESELTLGRVFDLNIFRLGGEGSRRVAVLFTDITERKRGEATLRESEERQEFLLRLSDALRPLADPIASQAVAVRLVGTHLGVDRCYYAEFDWPRDVLYIHHEYTRSGAVSAVGSHPISLFNDLLVHSHKGEPLVCDDIMTHPVFGGEAAAYRERGTDAFILMPLVKQGTMVACMCVTMEVARKWSAAEIALVEEVAERTWAAVERARAEATLRESERRFQAIGNLVPDLLWESEPNGSTNWYNQRWLEYTGQSFEQAIGSGWTDAIHPDDREGSAKRYGAAVAAGMPLRQEHRIRRHDGAYRWFVVSTSPLQDESGRVVKVYGAATDIHDRRVLLETILQSEARFRTLADAVPQVIWTNAATGEATYFNQRWYEYTGLTYEQSAGPGWQAIVHPDDAPASGERWQRALAEGALFDAEYRLRGADGTYRWFIGRNVPLKDEHGRVTGWFGSATDIQELTELRQDLEAQVAARTHALGQRTAELATLLSERQQLVARLVTAQEDERRRISRELHDELGQLITGLSLGLRNVESAFGASDPAAVAATAALPRLAALQDLTGQMSREVHRLAVELRPTALDDIGVAPAVESYLAAWSLRTSVPAEFAEIGLDGDRLPPLVETTVYRVVQEALTNAAKYAVPRGATRVSVTLQRRANVVQATIDDNGPGFDLDDASARGGLGLAGMRERAELAGGTLGIETEPGQGTTVFLRIPIEPTPPSA